METKSGDDANTPGAATNGGRPRGILVPEGFRPRDPDVLVGEAVEIVPPDGPAFRILAQIAGMRDLGTTISLLVEDWPAWIARPGTSWRIEVPAASE